VTPPAAPSQAEPGLFAPRIFLPFMLVSMVWGSTWLVIRDQINSVPAAWSVCYRFTVAATGMFILARIMKLSVRLDRQGQRWAMLLGVLQFALNFNFVYAAEHHITSGLVAVLFALLIMPNALLGQWWLGRKVAPSFWLGSAIATVGVALLILREYRVAPVGGTQVLIGTALTLAGVLSASVSNVIQASPRVSRYPIVTVLAWSMLWGALGNAIFAWTMHGAPVVEMRSGYLAGVLYLGVVGSVVTFPLYFGLIREIGPGKAAYSSVFVPVIAMALSTIFENYIWSSLAVGGAILAMIGLLVAMQARKA
jgi:drug/metabolite transporter (DMT)-like permease